MIKRPILARTGSCKTNTLRRPRSSFFLSFFLNSLVILAASRRYVDVSICGYGTKWSHDLQEVAIVLELKDYKGKGLAKTNNHTQKTNPPLQTPLYLPIPFLYVNDFVSAPVRT